MGQRPADLQGFDLDVKPYDISLRVEIHESEHMESTESVSLDIVVDQNTKSGHALK